MKILSQRGEGYRCGVLARDNGPIMGRDLGFNLRVARKRGIPSRLQFPGHQTVCRIDGVILAKGAVCCVAIAIVTTGKAVENIPVARPFMIVVAAPISACFAIPRVGEYSEDV